MIPADNMAERKRLFDHLRDLDHDDQILFIMACLGTDGMREINDFADRLVGGSAQDVAREAQRVSDALAGAEPVEKPRRRWLISYRHTSRDVMHDKAPFPEDTGFAIEITDSHPVLWLRDAVLRNLEPLSPDLHVDRRTRVDAIVSAIEIPEAIHDDDVAELEGHLS